MSSNYFLSLFSSSIGKKVIMAVTGLFICLFLVVHVAGNFQLFKADSGLAFNKYAVLMTTNPFIKTISYILYLTIIIHAIRGLMIEFEKEKELDALLDKVGKDGLGSLSYSERKRLDELSKELDR